MAGNLLPLFQESSSLIFLFGSYLYYNTLSIPFVHLPLMERKVICGLWICRYKMGPSCLFRIRESKNMKHEVFLQDALGFEVKNWERPIFHLTKICKYENVIVLQEIFLVHLYNMYSKYRVIFTSYTEESISLPYSYPFLIYIYINIIRSAVIRVQNIEI